MSPGKIPIKQVIAHTPKVVADAVIKSDISDIIVHELISRNKNVGEKDVSLLFKKVWKRILEKKSSHYKILRLVKKGFFLSIKLYIMYFILKTAYLLGTVIGFYKAKKTPPVISPPRTYSAYKTPKSPKPPTSGKTIGMKIGLME